MGGSVETVQPEKEQSKDSKESRTSKWGKFFVDKTARVKDLFNQFFSG